jgi:hypothetical protein
MIAYCLNHILLKYVYSAHDNMLFSCVLSAAAESLRIKLGYLCVMVLR